MQISNIYRWRKVSDINREHPLFELLYGDVPVLDVALSDEGVLEVTFNPGISGTVVEWATLLKLLNEGKALAERDP